MSYDPSTPFPLPTADSLVRNVLQELSLYLESVDPAMRLVPTPRVFLTHWEDQLRRALALAAAASPAHSAATGREVCHA